MSMSFQEAVNQHKNNIESYDQIASMLSTTRILIDGFIASVIFIIVQFIANKIGLFFSETTTNLAPFILWGGLELARVIRVQHKLNIKLYGVQANLIAVYPVRPDPPEK